MVAFQTCASEIILFLLGIVMFRHFAYMMF